MFTALAVHGQQPVINKVDRLSDYTQASIAISGSGFGTSSASVQVWFDQVRGSIASINDNTIVAIAPPEARLHNVEVINTTSHLSAKSSLKYMPSFSGEGFSTAKLAAPLSFPSTTAVFDLCSCDLTQDNKPELVGTKFENVATDILILHNQSTPGNLAFNAIDKTTLPVLNLNAPSGHVTCGDLNGDGKPDLVASRSGVTANSVYVLQNISTGTPAFAPRIELLLDAGHFARQVAIHDLNRDGKPEIIVANSFNNVLYVFMNQSTSGTLSISPTPVKITLSGVPNTLSLEVQDMDGDARPDIVLTQNQGSGIYLLKNTSTASVSFAPATIIPIPGSFNDLSSADFNNDGLLDLVVTSVFNAQALVLINKSTSSGFTFAAPITLPTGTGPFGSDVSDINGDGFPDIVVPTRGVAGIEVFLHNANNTTPGFSRTTITTAKTNWFVRAGDLDGDAKPDIAFTSFTTPTTYSVDILRNKNCYQPKVLNDPAITLCSGQTADLLAVPAPGATFNWFKSGVSFKNSADNFATVNSAGSYTVTTTTEGGACALTSPPVVVTTDAATAPAQPVISPVAPVCAGQAMNISTASVPGASYRWTGPDGVVTTESDPTLTIPVAANTHAGTYTLRIQVGVCTSPPAQVAAQVVNVGSFSINSSTPDPLCEGQSTVLSSNAGAGYSYQWVKNGTDVSGQTGSSLSVTQDGTYRVRITFSGCSAETPDQKVTVLTKPVSNFTLAPAACAGENISFASSAAVDSRATALFHWVFGDGATADVNNTTHTYSTAQSYPVAFTTSYQGVTGCAHTASKTIVITEATAPEILSDVTELCPGEQALLSLGNSYATITWSTGSGASSISVEQPGTYTVNTTDESGCKGSDEILLILKDGCGEVAVLIPNMFSPNGDQRNDRWIISGIDAHQDCIMNVFDDKGVSVYKQSGYPLEGWDGSFNGKPLPDGVYYYLLSWPDSKPITGSVLIVR